jgi:hypothetical protein
MFRDENRQAVRCKWIKLEQFFFLLQRLLSVT